MEFELNMSEEEKSSIFNEIDNQQDVLEDLDLEISDAFVL